MCIAIGARGQFWIPAVTASLYQNREEVCLYREELLIPKVGTLYRYSICTVRIG